MPTSTLRQTLRARSCITALALCASLSVACQPSSASPPPPDDAAPPASRVAAAAQPSAPTSEPALKTDPKPGSTPVKTADYPWLADWPEPTPSMEALSGRFAPPEGYRRVKAPAKSFAAWLRGLPLRTDRTRVRSYKGDPLGSPSAAVAVLDLEQRNLQQCADSAIRLHAEYLWHRDRADKVAYHFASGDRSTWKAWRAGERFKVKGRTVERVRGKARANTHAAFRRYLTHTFIYAGTLSLHRDSKAVPIGSPLEGGDFVLQAGSPGHAVVILDIAENAKGERVALLGQGFMPAQDFHVLTDNHALGDGNVWFPLPDDSNPKATLDTPSWRPFARAQARRFAHTR